MSIIDFDHINIRTANVTAMTAFYAEVLGLEEGWRPNFSFPGAWLYLAERPLMHLRYVDITPRATEVRIEHCLSCDRAKCVFDGTTRTTFLL